MPVSASVVSSRRATQTCKRTISLNELRDSFSAPGSLVDFQGGTVKVQQIYVAQQAAGHASFAPRDTPAKGKRSAVHAIFNTVRTG